MVFSYLTPVRFDRYSSFNLCPALSSLRGRCKRERAGGTKLVTVPALEPSNGKSATANAP
jgi:hypothetical protein